MGSLRELICPQGWREVGNKTKPPAMADCPLTWQEEIQFGGIAVGPSESLLRRGRGPTPFLRVQGWMP